MSLLRARILVTRPAGGWEELERRVAEAGGSLAFRSPTEAVPPSDPGPAARAAAEIGRFAWIVLTSARGVAALAERLDAAGADARSVAARIACVGPATARAARARGFAVAHAAGEGHGAALARELAALVSADDDVLVVRPESGSAFPEGVLERAGARVSSVAFYRTVASVEARAMAEDLAAGLYDVAVVTAPSALTALSPAALGRVRRVAIGATTASALARAGVPADAVAALPAPAAVADALETL